MWSPGGQNALAAAGGLLSTSQHLLEPDEAASMRAADLIWGSKMALVSDAQGTRAQAPPLPRARAESIWRGPRASCTSASTSCAKAARRARNNAISDSKLTRLSSIRVRD